MTQTPDVSLQTCLFLWNENLGVLTDVLLCCRSGGSVVALVTKVVGSDPRLLHSEARFLKTQNLQIAPEAVSLGCGGRFQTKSDLKFHITGLKK